MRLAIVIMCLFGMWISRKDMNMLVFNGFLAIINTIMYVFE